MVPGGALWHVPSLGAVCGACQGRVVRKHGTVPPEEYDRAFGAFDAADYDPRAWARMARQAGMKYAVLTAKHHEGFCLFDSAYTDYKATNTPAGRDLVREYLDAFRAEGLRVGLYYSLVDCVSKGGLIC